MIIDVHTHLGDILYPDGGTLIFKKDVRKNRRIDMIGLAEVSEYKSNFVLEWVLKNLFEDMVTASGVARNNAGTLENMRRSMDGSGIGHAACMPIPPFVSFEDLKKAQDLDPGVIPFTGIDFTREYDFEAELDDHVKQGAKGLKLHPIIQKTPFTDSRIHQALEAFAKHDLPVMFHSGKQSYFLGEEKTTRQNPEYGEVKRAIQMVKDFPQIRFIAGHAGIFEYKDTIGYLASCENVYVDTSFHCPSRIKLLLDAFGGERVMFASDWPWGTQKTALATVRKACGADRELEERLLYRNAAGLLKMKV